MKGIFYKGEFIAEGTQAIDIYRAALIDPKQFEKLNQHMARLAAEADARGDVPEPRKAPQKHVADL